MSTPQDEYEPRTTAATPVGDEPSLVADRYRILRTLGRGGGGHVWLARDEKLGREVALKKVAGEADAEVLMTRGFREARTTATLAHEHVVRVYDAFEHDGSPWIVMEYVPGPSLAVLIEGGRRLPVDQVATIGAQMATALAAAHSAGVLHRDVKPANVLLRDEAGRDAKLTDFGIARAEEDHQLTRTGFVSGTAAYFSPELARGEDPTPASDVWALGATLYTALEGRRPFPDRPNAVAQLHAIVREQPRAPEHAGPLTPILAGMLDPDPATRWDADHAARELAAVARGGAGPAPAGWPGAGAGAGAAAAAAAHRARHPGEDDLTRAVPPADSTRSLPVASGPQPVPAPDRRAPAGPAGEPSYHRPAPQRPTQQRPGQQRRRRPSIWLGWLLVIPLLAALGWLVWTIAEGIQPGGDDGPVSTADAGATGVVTTQEAIDLVDAFYNDVAYRRLDEARARLGPDAAVDDEITDGLTRLRYENRVASAQDDGTVDIEVDVNYSYGEVLYRQHESLVVGREDGRGEPLILERSTDEPDISRPGDDAGDG